jgi:soluble P-type ATPase
VVRKQGRECWLEASFDPQTIDSLHKSKLKVYITVDDKKDSLMLSRVDDKKYRMDFPIAVNHRLATIQMQTSNRIKYTKTILINEEIPDLQFFPESGLLVHGLQNRIGVKALDASGKGIPVQGKIIDQNESVIQSFNTNELGMGSFVINQADSSKTYFARVVSPSDKTIINVYPLPHVTAVGNVLSVARKNGEIELSVR